MTLKIKLSTLVLFGLCCVVAYILVGIAFDSDLQVVAARIGTHITTLIGLWMLTERAK
jgi:hypothetical protein